DDDAALPRRQGVERPLDLLHVLPHQPLRAAALARGVAQQVGGVEERHDLDAVPVEPAAAQPRDALVRLEEVLRRDVPQGPYHLRPDDPDLLEQHALAGGDLGRRGVAVSGRPELDDVRDVDLLALEADGGEDLVEELAGAADERAALQVFLLAGRLADEHERGVIWSLAEDEVVGEFAQRRRLLGREALELGERHASVDNTGTPAQSSRAAASWPGVSRECSALRWLRISRRSFGSRPIIRKKFSRAFSRPLISVRASSSLPVTNGSSRYALSASSTTSGGDFVWASSERYEYTLRRASAWRLKTSGLSVSLASSRSCLAMRR